MTVKDALAATVAAFAIVLSMFLLAWDSNRIESRKEAVRELMSSPYQESLTNRNIERMEAHIARLKERGEWAVAY